jgi:hypothetical protein
MFPLVQSGRPASEPTFHAETISHVETEKGDVCGTRSQLQGLHAMEDTQVSITVRMAAARSPPTFDPAKSQLRRRAAGSALSFAPITVSAKADTHGSRTHPQRDPPNIYPSWGRPSRRARHPRPIALTDW